MHAIIEDIRNSTIAIVYVLASSVIAYLLIYLITKHIGYATVGYFTGSLLSLIYFIRKNRNIPKQMKIILLILALWFLVGLLSNIFLIHPIYESYTWLSIPASVVVLFIVSGLLGLVADTKEEGRIVVFVSFMMSSLAQIYNPELQLSDYIMFLGSLLQLSLLLSIFSIVIILLTKYLISGR